MRVVAILQARMSSTRLPGKMLLPLLDKPLVQHVIERVRRSKRLHDVVLAYPLSDSASFAPVLRSMRGTDGVSLGAYAAQCDENDLVTRYLMAAEAYHADLIVRVPCDNPCVDHEYIDSAVEAYLASPWIFYSNTTIRMNSKWVDGLGCEVLSLSRLKWLDQMATSPLQREHPHAYFRDAGFIHWYEDWSRSSLTETLRLDVNTLDDYHFIENIYNHFGHNEFTAQDILKCPPVQERLHGRG